MCGKFTQMRSWREVHTFSQPLVAKSDDDIEIATPMRFASVVRLGAHGDREIVSMRWGFAGKDDTAPTRPTHMHARCETIDTRPTFTQAFAHRRGILMVHTFNEGEELPSSKTKQWVVSPRDGQPIAIAVIYETWRHGEETLKTFVQVTTPANALISRITDRMPAILPRQAWPIWLGETDASLDQIKAVLTTFEDRGTWTMTEQSPGARSRPPKRHSQADLF